MFKEMRAQAHAVTARMDAVMAIDPRDFCLTLDPNIGNEEATRLIGNYISVRNHITGHRGLRYDIKEALAVIGSTDAHDTMMAPGRMARSGAAHRIAYADKTLARFGY